MDELDGVIAARLQARLEAQQWLREDLAREMALLGFQWTGNTVSQVINGRRGLSLLELAGICETFGEPLAGLIPGGSVVVPSGYGVAVPEITEALRTGGGAWKARQAAMRAKQAKLEAHQAWAADAHRAAQALYGEADTKAARRLGITPAEVDAVALQLWGQPLGAEREERVGKRRIPRGDDFMRSLQAQRGHVTRELLKELREHLQSSARADSADSAGSAASHPTDEEAEA